MICLCCTDWTKYADNTEVVHSYKGWPIRSRHSRPERDRTDISNAAHWLGLRLAILLRRLSTMRLDHPGGALDVMRVGDAPEAPSHRQRLREESAVHTADV
jgi:hypothetical protein